MPLIIVRQSKEYSQYLHHNIPLYSIFYHTPSGYMDRYGSLKSMTQLSNIRGSSPVKNQILSSDGHDIHLDNGTIIQIIGQNIQHFVIKSGHSVNDHPHDDFPNNKLKFLYKVTKSACMLNYGKTKFSS